MSKARWLTTLVVLAALSARAGPPEWQPELEPRDVFPPREFASPEVFWRGVAILLDGGSSDDAFRRHRRHVLEAQRLAERGAAAEASRAFLALADEDPLALADVALFNAAVALEEAVRGGEARDLYLRLVRDYPGSRLAAQALLRAGVLAEKDGALGAALAAYAALEEQYPTALVRGDALFNAARLIELIHPGQAPEAWLRAADAAESVEAGLPARFRAAWLFERRGDLVKAQALWAECAAAPVDDQSSRGFVAEARKHLGAASLDAGR